MRSQIKIMFSVSDDAFVCQTEPFISCSIWRKRKAGAINLRVKLDESSVSVCTLCVVKLNVSSVWFFPFSPTFWVKTYLYCGRSNCRVRVYTSFSRLSSCVRGTIIKHDAFRIQSRTHTSTGYLAHDWSCKQKSWRAAKMIECPVISVPLIGHRSVWLKFRPFFLSRQEYQCSWSKYLTRCLMELRKRKESATF